LSSWFDSVSVTLWPAVTFAVACTQVPLFVQVLASIVVLVPLVLSFSVAEAQSYVTVSGHTTF
jgi:hypothetical protein